ncbi:MAG TPA: hypothetical protein VGI95_21800 [Caulobacteraceae bacterium]|jgi:hypothetical protein
MTEWQRVKWTETSQVMDLLDQRAPSDELGRTPPEVYFHELRSANRLDDATLFLALALPRQETVVWAAHCVRDLSDTRERSRTDGDAMKSALLWVQDPSEQRRRAAFVAANLAKHGSAERLAAMAVFYSGGSLSPEQYAPVPVPAHAAGHLSAAAILTAAGYAPDRKAAINRALDEGDAIAKWGLNGPPR